MNVIHHMSLSQPYLSLSPSQAQKHSTMECHLASCIADIGGAHNKPLGKTRDVALRQREHGNRCPPNTLADVSSVLEVKRKEFPASAQRPHCRAPAATVPARPTEGEVQLAARPDNKQTVPHIRLTSFMGPELRHFKPESQSQIASCCSVMSCLALHLYNLVNDLVHSVANPSDLFIPLRQVTPLSLKVDHVINLQDPVVTMYSRMQS